VKSFSKQLIFVQSSRMRILNTRLRQRVSGS